MNKIADICREIRFARKPNREAVVRTEDGSEANGSTIRRIDRQPRSSGAT